MEIKLDPDNQPQQNHLQWRARTSDWKHKHVSAFSEWLHDISTSFGSGNLSFEVPEYSGLKKLMLIWIMKSKGFYNLEQEKSLLVLRSAEHFHVCVCVCVCVCVYAGMYVCFRPFFFGGGLLSLEDRFLEITSAPYKEQGMDMNPVLSTQWGQVNRSKCLKFSLGSDCIHFLIQFSLPQMSFFMSLHAQSPLNPLRHSYKVTSSTKLSIIHHSELPFSFLNLPSHFSCKFTWRIPLSDLHGNFVLA